MEVQINFHSYEEWMDYFNSDKRLNETKINIIGTRMLFSKALEPVTNRVIKPFTIEKGSSWREGLVSNNLSSRLRAILYVMQDILQGDKNPRIYAPEAVTHFALLLRGLYPRFIGSEYMVDPEQRKNLWPIPSEDLTALSFGNDLFDMIVTNEVIEHVPSIDKALQEMHRVLRPGGWHIGTHPFAYVDRNSILKSEIIDGKIVHRMEPEYHGNPINDEGSLVFEVPGWDILERAKKAGFSSAFMKFVISKKHACLANEVGGVFVLCCQK
jgi:SAM-dependent methyltransferase